jgi:hypothetical protein
MVTCLSSSTQPDDNRSRNAVAHEADSCALRAPSNNAAHERLAALRPDGRLRRACAACAFAHRRLPLNAVFYGQASQPRGREERRCRQGSFIACHGEHIP